LQFCDISEELISHLGQGKARDIQFVLLDQTQEKGQGTLEDGGVHFIAR